MKSAGRLRALSWFIIAGIYFAFSQQISLRAANGLSSGDLFLLIDSLILLFLLLVGYAAMGYAGQSQREPLKTMGLVRREGWKREFALGAALGWGAWSPVCCQRHWSAGWSLLSGRIPTSSFSCL